MDKRTCFKILLGFFLILVFLIILIILFKKNNYKYYANERVTTKQNNEVNTVDVTFYNNSKHSCFLMNDSNFCILLIDKSGNSFITCPYIANSNLVQPNVLIIPKQIEVIAKSTTSFEIHYDLHAYSKKRNEPNYLKMLILNKKIERNEAEGGIKIYNKLIERRGFWIKVKIQKNKSSAEKPYLF